jgi:hypothetical protein
MIRIESSWSFSLVAPPWFSYLLPGSRKERKDSERVFNYTVFVLAFHCSLLTYFILRPSYFALDSALPIAGAFRLFGAGNL